MTPNTAHSATPGSSPNGRTLSLASRRKRHPEPHPRRRHQAQVANATHGGGEDVSLRFEDGGLLRFLTQEQQTRRWALAVRRVRCGIRASPFVDKPVAAAGGNVCALWLH